MTKLQLHSTGDASSLAALILAQILPVFSVVAPCQRVALSVSVRRWSLVTGCQRGTRFAVVITVRQLNRSPRHLLTEARILAAMDSGTEQSVALKQPLPIYLVYFTAWEEKGGLQIRPDVYGHDRRHGKADD